MSHEQPIQFGLTQQAINQVSMVLQDPVDCGPTECTCIQVSTHTSRGEKGGRVVVGDDGLVGSVPVIDGLLTPHQDAATEVLDLIEKESNSY